MAELPGIERETLDVDVVIVGAGPAGLAAAYRLAELIKAHNESASASIAFRLSRRPMMPALAEKSIWPTSSCACRISLPPWRRRS